MSSLPEVVDNWFLYNNRPDVQRQTIELHIERCAVNLLGKEKQYGGFLRFPTFENGATNILNEDIQKIQLSLHSANDSLTFSNNVLIFHSEFQLKSQKFTFDYKGNKNIKSKESAFLEIKDILKLKFHHGEVEVIYYNQLKIKDIVDALQLEFISSVELLDILIQTLLRSSPFPQLTCRSVRDFRIQNTP